ncbi:hypothetical protein GGS20DRAFT_571638 [Poronia punctata]|nr:hypothetical protein GGS20DRAFT_571638 [Poronia punctata]
MEQKTHQPRQKMSYACEACRAAKTRCQSGPQPGICKRCSEFKRECIFRTGPRTRRPKNSIRADADVAGHPPPGPSKTFSIDFDMPVVEEPSDDFEQLRQQHEKLLEDLVLNDDDEDEEVLGGETQPFNNNNNNNNMNPTPIIESKQKAFSFNNMSPSISGTESSSVSEAAPKRSKPLLDLGIKPQFNLENASKLLDLFRNMLSQMPFLVLPEDEDVRSLARKAPFVLLAILAVTSCSTNLQGHSLYDEEFRKVFGIKFVAGGERSLELLQGLLIYCTWYPFHLRPRNKQTYQYMKMAVDIVHDLELDQEPDFDLRSAPPMQRTAQLDNLRALLACFYTISTFASTWAKSSTLRYSPQLARCAEALERGSDRDEDHILVWLVRFQYVHEEVVEVQRNFDRGFRDNQSAMQRDLIRAGLESQFRDFKDRIPEKYASSSNILLSTLLVEIFILAPGLMRLPKSNPVKDINDTTTSHRILCAAQKVRQALDHIASLPATTLSAFCTADYGRFVIFVVLGYRMSFPLVSICRDYDVANGRKILDFGQLLQNLAAFSEEEEEENQNQDTKKKKRSDTYSAIKVVLRSVITKYAEKSAALEAMSTAAAAAAAARGEWAARDLRSTCPMLNGSLDQYIPLWAGQPAPAPAPDSSHPDSGSYHATDEDYGTSSSTGLDISSLSTHASNNNLGMGFVVQQDTGTKQHTTNTTMQHHDLWATMTMGWGAGDLGEVNMEDFGNTAYAGGFLES